MAADIWHQAIRLGDADAIKKFAMAGGDLDAVYSDTAMALIHGAVEAERDAVLEQLVALGADPDGLDANGLPALHHAIDLDILDESVSEADLPRTCKLLALGADPRVINGDGLDARGFVELVSPGFGPVFDEILAKALKIGK